MATFLLEIGTEELPADFARLALPQLEHQVRKDLDTQRLSHGDIHTSSTPRRLIVRVDGLAVSQSDLEEERKGPPGAQAFRDGQPTEAAVGFARRCGVAVETLEVRETAKGPFVFARCREQGRATTALLLDLIPAWIAALQGRRFMRWGNGELRFSRPVRWLVALLDHELIPVQLEGSDPPLTAGRRSRGHRLHRQELTISSAESYAKELAAAGVEVNRQDRAGMIRTAIESRAAALDARADMPEQLFDELTDLVEAPLVLEGQIEPGYLNLPAEVLSTVMRSHQRYVPLYRRDGAIDPLALEARGCLLPRFLCVGNGLPASLATVRRGNERVLKARLADAEFFIRTDRRIASIDRRSQLARVTFAEGLGSLLDRVERLEWLTDVLLEALPMDAPSADHTRRAAHLCKHDLVSQMVGEFPELQGVIGGKYLLAEGEPRAVALAVQEHYRPRGAGDALPDSAPGAMVAMAERLELLLSIFAKGERPTGSSDPYALRRAGNGVLQILWSRGWTLDLLALLQRSCGHWAEQFPAYALEPTSLAEELAEFLRQRLVSLLEEDGIDFDVVEAVAGVSTPLDRLLRDPDDARQRAELLVTLRRSGDLAAVQAVVIRAARLAEKARVDPGMVSPVALVDAALFTSPSEQAMLEALMRMEPLAAGKGSDRYGALASALAASAPTLAAFFDGDQSVMVMADDPAVRTNRLQLLAVLRNQASVLADFSRLSS